MSLSKANWKVHHNSGTFTLKQLLGDHLNAHKSKLFALIGDAFKKYTFQFPKWLVVVNPVCSESQLNAKFVEQFCT